MGLFKNFKKKLDGEIKLAEAKGNYLIFDAKLPSHELKFGSALTVPAGFAFAVCINGKVLDIMGEGEHILSQNVLKETTKKLLSTYDKKELYKFKCDAYFVSLNKFNFIWETYRKAELGGKSSGIFKLGAFGTCEVKVQSVKEFMQSILNELAFVKNGESEKMLEGWVGEHMVRVFEKYNFALSEVLSFNDIISTNAFLEIKKLLEKAGLEVCEFKIDNLSTSKKYQDEINQSIKRKRQETQSLDNSEEKDTTSFLESIGTYVPFGSIKIEERKMNIPAEIKPEEKYIEEEPNKVYEPPYQAFGNMNVKTKREYNNKDFVDLNQIKDYTSNNVKRCLNCGTENEKNEEFCLVCGEKLN